MQHLNGPEKNGDEVVTSNFPDPDPHIRMQFNLKPSTHLKDIRQSQF